MISILVMAGMKDNMPKSDYDSYVRNLGRLIMNIVEAEAQDSDFEIQIVKKSKK